MFCNKCGAELPDGSAFCNKCGAVLPKKPSAGRANIPAPENTPVSVKAPANIPAPANAPVSGNGRTYGSSIATGNIYASGNTATKGSAVKKKTANPIIIAAILLFAIVCIVKFSGVGGSSEEESGYCGNNNSTTHTMTHTTAHTTQSTSQSTIQSTTQSTTEHSTQTTEATTEEVDDGISEYTFMFYFIATNLESGELCQDGTYEGGKYATNDINEIISANSSDEINIVLETGATPNWQNNLGMEPYDTQVFHKEGKKLVEDKNLGKVCMMKQESLEDFLSYCKKNYPAKKYVLVLWNHGIAQGTVNVGYDVMGDGHSHSLESYQIGDAIRNSGLDVYLTLFNTCMTGTVDMASELAGASEYVIASEEVTYTTAFDYKKWLNAIAENPKMDIMDFADSFMSDFQSQTRKRGLKYDIALIDTSKTKVVVEKLSKYIEAVDKKLYNRDFDNFLKARSACGTYGSGKYNLVDIVDLCNNYSIDGAKELIAAVDDAVLLFYSNINHSNGLSFYCPGNDEMQILDYSYYGRNDLSNLDGYNNVKNFCDDFITLIGLYSYSDKLNSLGIDKYYNSTLANIYTSDATDYTSEEIKMSYTKRNGKYYLDFGDRIDDINIIEKRVGYEYNDGKAIVLGCDFRTTVDNGSIDISFPTDWPAVEGQTVCYIVTNQYYDSEGKFHATGIIPFIFPDTFSNSGTIYGLKIDWYEKSDGKRSGKLVGYSKIDTSTMTLVDGSLSELEAGDNIKFIYATVEHNGTTLDESSVTFVDLFDTVQKVPSGGLTIKFEDISSFEKDLKSRYGSNCTGYTYAVVTDKYGIVYTSDLVPAN